MQVKKTIQYLLILKMLQNNRDAKCNKQTICVLLLNLSRMVFYQI